MLSFSPCLSVSLLSHTLNLRLWFPSPASVLPEQACVPTCCLLILYKRHQASHWTGDTAQTQQTSTQCVNTCSTDWLSDIDSSVYTSAFSKLELIIVDTQSSWNRLSISGGIDSVLVLEKSSRTWIPEWVFFKNVYTGGSIDLKWSEAVTPVLPKAKNSGKDYCADPVSNP